MSGNTRWTDVLINAAAVVLLFVAARSGLTSLWITALGALIGLVAWRGSFADLIGAWHPRSRWVLSAIGLFAVAAGYVVVWAAFAVGRGPDRLLTGELDVFQGWFAGLYMAFLIRLWAPKGSEQ